MMKMSSGMGSALLDTPMQPPPTPPSPVEDIVVENSPVETVAGPVAVVDVPPPDPPVPSSGSSAAEHDRNTPPRKAAQASPTKEWRTTTSVRRHYRGVLLSV